MPVLRRSREMLLVVLALLLYWGMAASVSPRMGVTADEVVHLTGGYSYWKFNDYRLQPENGTLPMRLAALPLLGMDLKFPALDDPHWLNSKVNLAGETFFYQLGNPTAEMLQRGRAAIALLGVFTCWLTWRWARGLFGRAAGLLALALAVFCPALLAHGGLITSDMAFTACALAALSAVWRLLHRGTWGRLLAAGLACGACFLSKMSGGFVVPLIALLLLLRWLRPVPYVIAFGGHTRWLRRRGRIAAATLGLLVATAALSLTLVWANYSFRFTGPDLSRSGFNDYYFPWDVVLDQEKIPWSDSSSLSSFTPPFRTPQPSGITKLVGFLRDHRLLPEAYLWGFAHTYKFAKERPAYFMGEYRKTGWPLFFPVAFLMKTSLPALLLFAAGVAAVVWRQRRGPLPAHPWVRFRRSTLYRAAPLILFFAAYWLMAVRMTLNLGHRHILPVYPIFYIFAAAAALWLVGRTWRTVLAALAAGVALHAFDSVSARPFYLSYFQPLTGGPERAYHYFVESSLDWGQGLPDLKTWLAGKKAQGDPLPVFLTYFGADSPRNYGLDVTRFGDEMNDSGIRYFPAQVRGGWFVISATYFHCTFLPMRGTWAEPQETLYWQLVGRVGELSARTTPLTEEEQTRLSRDAMDIEILQFARLCRYLRDREPRRLIGASLMLFQLTDEEVRAALYGPVPLDAVRELR